MPRFLPLENEDLEFYLRTKWLAGDGDFEDGIDCCMNCALTITDDTGVRALGKHEPYGTPDDDCECFVCMKELKDLDN